MKLNKWIKIVIVIISLSAIYIAFDIRRGVALYNRGTNHMAEGEYDQAIACFDKAIKADGKFTDAYYNRGTAYYEKGMYDKAVRDYDRAIELEPELAEAYYNRGMIYYHKEQYAQALEDIIKAQNLGHYVAPDLLEDLREASGRK